MAMHKKSIKLILSAATVLYCCFLPCCQSDESYENMTDLMDKVLGTKSNYNPDMRPRDYHSDPVLINVGFSIVSLVEINDVKQSFKLNAFLTLEWNDERVYWDKTEYDGADYLAPRPKNIWRPRMVMLNTLGDRDLFKDDFSPLTAYFDGDVHWMPGGLFEASCALDMSKYPFDEQTCFMLFCPMSHSSETLIFIPSTGSFDMTFFVSNEAWESFTSEVTTTNVSAGRNELISCPHFSFTVKRRPSYFIINFILPIIMLSFLNNFVFLIPDESGEKIGYGITVLLSLSVFLTTLSSMIPRTSNNIPAVTIYLFILMLFSGIGVLLSIATVFLQNAEEDETAHLKVQKNYKQAVKKISGINRAIGKIEPVDNSNISYQRRKSASPSEITMTSSENGSPPKNKYRKITKHMNKICFVLSITLWAIIQLVYFVYVRT